MHTVKITGDYINAEFEAPYEAVRALVDYMVTQNDSYLARASDLDAITPLLAPDKGASRTSTDLTADDIRPNIQSLKITPDYSMLPALPGLKARSKKILWVLEYARFHQIESLSKNEILHLVDKLRIPKISSKTFNSANMPNIRDGLVMRDDDTFKSTATGIAALQKG